MSPRAITLIFLLVMSGYISAVFLWPFGSNPAGTTDRLAGEPVETAFLPERFGVPAPTEQVAPG